VLTLHGCWDEALHIHRYPVADQPRGLLDPPASGLVQFVAVQSGVEVARLVVHPNEIRRAGAKGVLLDSLVPHWDANGAPCV
jgi:hypothetical protein